MRLHDFVAPAPNPPPAADTRMQQATVNLFADMGVQPATLQSGLVPATESTDTIAPTSAILTAPGGTVPAGTPVTITGTATDTGGGIPAGVEFSYDGGTTWHPASGAATWSATWTPSVPGLTTLRSRAVDDSGRLETPGPGITLTVTENTAGYSLWPPTVVPAVLDQTAGSPLELGVRFQADHDGWIHALRFYKCAANTGIHEGHLWAGDGTLLSTATFSGESASGWQEVQLPAPIPITAGTTYIASYHLDSGHFSKDDFYFANQGYDRSPLHALAAGATGPNGVYHVGTSAFPTDSYQSSNYWVDVVYTYTMQSSSPAAPDGLTASFVSGGQIHLTWFDNSANETGFKIERKTGAGGSYAQIATVGAGVTTYANTGLTKDTTYYYRVRATNGSGDSVYSPEASATTTNTAPVANAQTVMLNANGTVAITLTGSDSDGDSLTFAVAIAPAHGSVDLTGAVATYTPNLNYSGPDSFTFTAYDGTVSSAAATVSIDGRTDWSMAALSWCLCRPHHPRHPFRPL